MTDQQKIKLLIFTPTLHCGGSEKFVSVLCNHINTGIFSVSLVVLNNSTPFYNITNSAIKVIDLKEARVRFTLFKIKALIKHHKPAIVFTTANHLNLYFAIFRRLFPRSLKFVARESSIISINSQRATWPRVYNWLIKKYYRRFDFIVCQSAYMQQDLISNYNFPVNKTCIIYNTVAENSKSEAVNTANNINKKYKFITVARMSAEKGIERLIHAVGLLALPFQFYIFGGGSKMGYLQNLVRELQLENKVIFKGERTEPFLGMEDSSLFLMGSYYEGSPNVLLEAGNLGIPVIAFDVPGGIREIITQDENGVLVEDNDILAFAAAIRKSLLSHFNRNKIIETTQKRFSLHKTVTEVENLFIQIQ